MSSTNWLFTAALSLLVVIAAAAADGLAAEGGDDVPVLTLWAWQRPEDLRFLDGTGQVGVAFLAATARLVGGQVAVAPRGQPLALPVGTATFPVVRIESDQEDSPSLSRGQRQALLEAILSLVPKPEPYCLQLDFDAALSERSFYGDLLRDLRASLPPRTALSITALSSWCMGDPWLENLPVDEAVPMLFRMGADGVALRRALARGVDFTGEVCRQSVGLASDEPLPLIPAGRRVYLFHPRPWTEDALKRMVSALRWLEP